MSVVEHGQLRHMQTICSHFLSHTSPVVSVSDWLEDASILISQSSDLAVWDLHNQTRIYHRDLGSGSQLGASRGSRTIAFSCANDKPYGVLEVRQGWDGNQLFRKKIHSNHLSGIAVNDSGSIIATSSYDGGVKLVNIDTGVVKAIGIQAPDGFHHSDQLAAIDDRENTLVIWGTLSGVDEDVTRNRQFLQLSPLNGMGGTFFTYSIFPEAATCGAYDKLSVRLLLGLSNGDACLIDAADGGLIARKNLMIASITAAASCDEFYYIASSDGSLSKWRKNLTECVFRKSVAREGISALNVCKSTCTVSCGTTCGSIILLSANSGDEIRERNHFGSIHRVGFHGDEAIAALHGNKSVRSYISGHTTASFEALNNLRAESIVILKRPPEIATLSTGGILNLVDMDSRQIKHHVRLSVGPDSVSCSDRSGTSIVTVDPHGRLSVVDSSNGSEHQYQLTPPPRGVLYIAADITAGIIAVAGWREVRFFKRSMESNCELVSISTYELTAGAEIWDLCWRGYTDELLIGVSMANKGGIRVLNREGSLLSKVSCSMRVTCIASDMLGHYVYAGTACGSIVRWCISERHSVICKSQTHRGEIVSLDVNTGAPRIVSGGADGIIQVWDIETT